MLSLGREHHNGPLNPGFLQISIPAVSKRSKANPGEGQFFSYSHPLCLPKLLDFLVILHPWLNFPSSFGLAPYPQHLNVLKPLPSFSFKLVLKIQLSSNNPPPNHSQLNLKKISKFTASTFSPPAHSSNCHSVEMEFCQGHLQPP